MNDGTVSVYSTRTEPEIVEKKDGPMLLCTDGTVHFLTWFETLMYRLGFYTIEELDTYYREDYVYGKRVWW